jgi:hypothetical protein
MRIAAFLVALFSIVVGIVGIVSPEYGTMLRRQYFGSPVTLYPAVALRMVMGLVVILAARTSRAPTIMRTLGGLMCLQALTATMLGPDHARAVMEWETKQGTAMLRIGAAVALAAGGFMAFAVSGSGPKKAHVQPGRTFSGL